MKFIRDSMAVDDIEGSKPKIEKERQQRDTFNVHDIKGTQPKKIHVRSVLHDQSYNDVTAKKIFNRVPVSNPSDPIYRIRDDQNKVIEYGEINGSKPKVAYFKTDTKFCDMALKSRDIHGNIPGSKSKGNFHLRDRRDQVRQLTQNGDIVGSTPGTLVKGIKLPEGMKNRESNPLNPVYQIPGASEVPVEKINDPFGEKGCSMSKQNYQSTKDLRAAAKAEARPPLSVASGSARP